MRFLTVTALAAVAALAWGGLVYTATGYYTPVFSPDGDYVYFIERSSRATVLGPGWEHFSPPAKSFLHRDHWRVVRVPSRGGKLAIVADWGSSPFQGVTRSVYRGRVFGVGSGHLRWKGQTLEAEGSLHGWSIRLGGTWTRRPATMAGLLDASVRGDLELLTIPGPETLPCGIAVHNSATNQLRVLVRSGDCKLGNLNLAEHSRRSEILRLRDVRDTHARLVQEARRRGLKEGAAILEANRGLQERGLYPKPTQIVATKVARANEVIRVTQTEWTAGLFQDLEAALASPGKAVEKSLGEYIRMDGQTSSAKINAALASGRFFVEKGGQIYEIRLILP